MNIVLYGATGQAGSRILSELLSRGHQVTAISRSPGKLAAAPNLSVRQDDLSDTAKSAALIHGADAVISAYKPPDGKEEELSQAVTILIGAVASAGSAGPRLLMVGGAGSLEVAPGVSLYDSGMVPEAWRPIAAAHVKARGLLQASEIDWTYFAPAGFFEPGARTGRFRLGENQLIANEAGESRISMEDYAIAMVDEIETPAHRRGQFTIGY